MLRPIPLCPTPSLPPPLPQAASLKALIWVTGRRMASQHTVGPATGKRMLTWDRIAASNQWESGKGNKSSTGHHCQFSPGLCCEKANTPLSARGAIKQPGDACSYDCSAERRGHFTRLRQVWGKKHRARQRKRCKQDNNNNKKRHQRPGNTPQSFSWDFALYFAPLKHVMVEDWLVGLSGRI